jgi:hypothetical protein
MSAPAALAHAIDLERYPIDELDGRAARARRPLPGAAEPPRRERACGFLRAEVVADAVRSVQGPRSLAFRTEPTHNLQFTDREAA